MGIAANILYKGLEKVWARYSSSRARKLAEEAEARALHARRLAERPGELSEYLLYNVLGVMAGMALLAGGLFLLDYAGADGPIGNLARFSYGLFACLAIALRTFRPARMVAIVRQVRATDEKRAIEGISAREPGNSASLDETRLYVSGMLYAAHNDDVEGWLKLWQDAENKEDVALGLTGECLNALEAASLASGRKVTVDELLGFNREALLRSLNEAEE